jgi:hypothetical protein
MTTRETFLQSYCCGSGSGRVGAILPDPHPGPADPECEVCVCVKCEAKLYFLPENLNILSKILKMMTPLTLIRKI